MILAGLVSVSAIAAPVSFDFKDPKGVNNIAFKLDAPLEAISGTGTGISGTVLFDPADPAATSGTIVLSTESLNVGNSTMRGHMLGEGWLNAAANPEITFELVSLSNVKTEGITTKADATGKLTLKGITREVTAPVTLTYLEGRLGERQRGAKGDLLVIRSTFAINRSDFDIKKGQNLDTVAEEIQLTLSLAGVAPKT